MCTNVRWIRTYIYDSLFENSNVMIHVLIVEREKDQMQKSMNLWPLKAQHNLLRKKEASVCPVSGKRRVHQLGVKEHSFPVI